MIIYIEVERILDSQRNGVIVIDQSGIIESFDFFAENMFGYSCNEVIGQPIDSVLDVPDDYIKDCLETGKGCEGDSQLFTAIKKCGEVITVSLHITEIYLNGNTLITGIVRKIDEEDLAYHTQLCDNLREMKALTQQLKGGK